MEVLREEKAETSTGKMAPSFNPCFNGSVERGADGGIFFRAAATAFQSLF